MLGHRPRAVAPADAVTRSGSACLLLLQPFAGLARPPPDRQHGHVLSRRGARLVHIDAWCTPWRGPSRSSSDNRPPDETFTLSRTAPAQAGDAVSPHRGPCGSSNLNGTLPTGHRRARACSAAVAPAPRSYDLEPLPRRPRALRSIASRLARPVGRAHLALMGICTLDEFHPAHPLASPGRNALLRRQLVVLRMDRHQYHVYATIS